MIVPTYICFESYALSCDTVGLRTYALPGPGFDAGLWIGATALWSLAAKRFFKPVIVTFAISYLLLCSGISCWSINYWTSFYFRLL
jgi:hypothetical protein